ncbi:hypothetical protein [Georgenia sp. Z1491]|uniref:hypothetical protein n=1 Tax=Georgenia sp. Z1491 TaxID=3416707 RepID=UPI003CF0A084
MTTTIKVTSDLRDTLKAQAAARGRTLGEHLAALAEEEARRQRYARVREAMAANPPDQDYLDEVREWQSDAWT